MRTVPPEIPRPDYAETGEPVRRPEPRVKSADVIERMRVAGRAAAEVLEIGGAAVAPGVTTDEIDAIVHQAYIDRGGYPSTLELPGLPQVAVHLGERGHLPRHPRRPGAARRRHRQPRRHHLPRRRARRHQRHLPGRRGRRRQPPAGRGHPRVPRARHRRRRPRPPVLRHRPGHRGPRHRPPATRSCGRSSATASASSSTPTCRSPTTTSPALTTVMEPGMTFTIEPMISMGTGLPRALGRRLDRGHRRRQPHRPVRAHPARHRRRRRGPHRATAGRLRRCATPGSPWRRSTSTTSSCLCCRRTCWSSATRRPRPRLGAGGHLPAGRGPRPGALPTGHGGAGGRQAAPGRRPGRALRRASPRLPRRRRPRRPGRCRRGGRPRARSEAT